MYKVKLTKADFIRGYVGNKRWKDVEPFLLKNAYELNWIKMV